MKGRKIPAENDNPIDNIFIELSEYCSSYLKEKNVIPNQLTTCSFICSLIALYNMYYYNLIQFSIWFIVSYIFDCMDGYYARKYDMVTKFGDIYDHFTDLLSVVGVIIIAYMKYNLLNHLITLSYMFVFLFIGLIYISCQELLMKKEHQSGFLKLYESILPSNRFFQDYFHYLKYFGTGSLMFLLVFYVFYLYVCL